MALRRATLVAAAAIALAGCGGRPAQSASTPKATPTPSPPSSAQLAAYLARGSDIGPGWTDAPGDNPTSLASHPELHPCKFDYPSDSERLAGNSLVITSAGERSLIKDEVAYYAYTGARQAVKDLQTAAGKCQTYHALDFNGDQYDFEVLPSSISGKLGDESYAVGLRGTHAGVTLYFTEVMARVGAYVAQVTSAAPNQAEADQVAQKAAAASVSRLQSGPH